MKVEKCFKFFSHLPVTCMNQREAWLSVQIRDVAKMLSYANFVRTVVDWSKLNEVPPKLGTFPFSEESRRHEASICHKIQIYIWKVNIERSDRLKAESYGASMPFWFVNSTVIGSVLGVKTSLSELFQTRLPRSDNLKEEWEITWEYFVLLVNAAL